MHQPENNCSLCPRLSAFRAQNRVEHPHYYNAPVPAFGNLDARLLVVGLAPGLQGANQTGRPFTGDYAGFVLYESLIKMGFAKGNYLATLPKTLDGRVEGNNAANAILGQGGEFHLINTRITNAVRCLPPENKPEPSEIKQCNNFLKAEIAAMPNLKVILCLGLVSHNAVLAAFGLKASVCKFAHGAEHRLSMEYGVWSLAKSTKLQTPNSKLHLLNSYHCSRYNINTKRLSQEMFDEIIQRAKSLIA